MKLTSVELHPDGISDIAILSFRDPRTLNPYNVKGIVGLDADSIFPKYYWTSPGKTKFYNLVLEKREIVLRIGLNPDFSLNQTYSDLRDGLYKMVSSSRTGKLQLQFKNDTNVVAVLSGFVIKVEAPNFEKMQEVQITVKCDESFLKSLIPIEFVAPAFDPDLTIIDDVLSTAPHGFKFVIEFTNTVADIVISDPDDANWSFSITPVGGFLSGDLLYFSSEQNDKYLYMVRGGVTTQLADRIGVGSQWPIMFPGENKIRITHPTSLIWNVISYFPTYWGV